ncbi:hypothetical protein DTO063F5_3808 [Paecilomyces variotii]|nr:hypothetical protein DTO063F5_3808 [Paecilomyces variotii]
MSRCKHNFWIDLADGKAGPQLVYGSRLARLVGELPGPATQWPQVVFFMGRRLKIQAMRHLCHSRGQHHHQEWVDVHLDNRTLRSQQPRFFADCDPTSRSLQPLFQRAPICHQEEVFPLDFSRTEYSWKDLVLSRLLFLFVDVLCIFADDVGGFEGVYELLSTWAKIGSASSLPHAVRPRVIVVTGQTHSITHDLLDEQDFFLKLLDADDFPFFATFGDIQVSKLQSEALSPQARYMTLESDITRQLRNMTIIRERHRLLFSGIHLNAFFELALQHISVAPLSPFDFVRSSRQHNPLDGAFMSHLINFIRLGNSGRAPYDTIASYIASAILMDAYPPGMHVFSPVMAFDALYREACYTALRNCYSTDGLASKQCRRIENHLVEFLETMTTSSLSSSQVHKRNLLNQRQFWGPVKSNKTCLWCLRRHPEHPQLCGHTICDTCVEIFGKSSPHAEYEYIISDCMLCDSSKGLTVRLKPPTAAARILSIDGGGLRAIIPLENLEILQEVIGPDLPLVDLFDLSVGTSSGGLIVLSMRILRMGISQCKMLFQSLAKEVLSSTRRKRFLSFWLSDGAYDTGVLEDALKDHFHPSRRLFDAPTSLLSSGKVAVTASSISDGSLFIFTNYNGTAPHRAEPAYQRLRPDAEDEPYVWQVARATAAAPP